MHISKIVPVVYYTSHIMKRAINFPTSSPPPNYCAILKAMNCKNKSLAYISNWKFKYKRFPVYETQDGFCIIYKQTLLQSGIME